MYVLYSSQFLRTATCEKDKLCKGRKIQFKETSNEYIFLQEAPAKGTVCIMRMTQARGMRDNLSLYNRNNSIMFKYTLKDVGVFQLWTEDSPPAILKQYGPPSAFGCARGGGGSPGGGHHGIHV
jgi:hypothetical protein